MPPRELFSIDSGRATPSLPSPASGGGKGGGYDLSFADFAVLYRTDAQSAALCEAFERAGMPYKRSSHRPLAEEPAVQVLLQALAETDARPSEALRTAAAANSDASAAIALQRLAALVASCRDDRGRFLDAVGLASEAEFFDPRVDRVSLLTLHAAKGLEFPVVFITGLEDGLLPLHWSEPDEAALAEERRLFYVGMTRAKDRLFLSRASQRLWRGRVQVLPPSPFLRDIEAELLKHQRTSGPRRRRDDRQLKLL